MLTPAEEAFLVESNKIEGITRPVYEREKVAFKLFLGLRTITIDDIIRLVGVFQPDAKLRERTGMNVRVGHHYPPPGGQHVATTLGVLLSSIMEERLTPYEAHQAYEFLHPFTDCNGRSGRMLWWWMMRGDPLGFLHRWYYQSLEEGGTRG